MPGSLTYLIRLSELSGSRWVARGTHLASSTVPTPWTGKDFQSFSEFWPLKMVANLGHHFTLFSSLLPLLLWPPLSFPIQKVRKVEAGIPPNKGMKHLIHGIRCQEGLHRLKAKSCEDKMAFLRAPLLKPNNILCLCGGTSRTKLEYNRRRWQVNGETWYTSILSLL